MQYTKNIASIILQWLSYHEVTSSICPHRFPYNPVIVMVCVGVTFSVHGYGFPVLNIAEMTWNSLVIATTFLSTHLDLL